LVSNKKPFLSLDKDDLVKVIQDLYHLNNDNKLFLNTHLGMGDSETLAQPYRKTIKQVFNPDRGFPSLSVHSARKALYDFRKASANPEAIVDMMVYYVEQGVTCTLNYGDINEAFYNSLEGVFENAIALIKKTGDPELIEAFRPRVKRIVAKTSGIGWGFMTSYPMFTMLSTHPRSECLSQADSQIGGVGLRKPVTTD
jgi:hypothetical protein